MKKNFQVFLSLAAGMLTAELTASLLVYLSSRRLWMKTKVLADAGYLTLPNSLVQPSLLDWGAAFKGGVFFTLSAGAALSFVSLVFFMLWDRVFKRGRAGLTALVLVWSGLAAGANINGFEPVGTCLALTVPPAVFLIAVMLMPRSEKRISLLAASGFMLPMVILALAWFTLAGKDVFLDIRDYVLWSSRTGRAVSAFYYDNTMYAAEMIKNYSQKNCLSCRLPDAMDARDKARLRRLLIHFDYLPISGDHPADLELTMADNDLVFKHKGGEVLRTPFNSFTADPTRYLNRFSEKTDNRLILRRAAFYSLLFPAPAALYALFFSFLFGGARAGLAPVRASLAAGAICLVLGGLFMSPVWLGRASPNKAPNLLLASEKWTDRVAGLRKIVNEKYEIANFPRYRRLLDSPILPERYWLAAALGNGKADITYPDLLKMLDDPQPNVVCRALESLSRRHKKDARDILLDKLKTSDHWYVQWYAYHALRSMGWRQKASD